MKVVFEGDVHRRGHLAFQGMTKLNALKKDMSFNDLSQGMTITTMPDGSKIKVSSTFGQDIIRITAPGYDERKESKKTREDEEDPKAFVIDTWYLEIENPDNETEIRTVETAMYVNAKFVGNKDAEWRLVIVERNGRKVEELVDIGYTDSSKRLLEIFPWYEVMVTRRTTIACVGTTNAARGWDTVDLSGYQGPGVGTPGYTWTFQESNTNIYASGIVGEDGTLIGLPSTFRTDFYYTGRVYLYESPPAGEPEDTDDDDDDNEGYVIVALQAGIGRGGAVRWPIHELWNPAD